MIGGTEIKILLLGQVEKHVSRHRVHMFLGAHHYIYFVFNIFKFAFFGRNLWYFTIILTLKTMKLHF